jgi:hypothetical protein
MNKKPNPNVVQRWPAEDKAKLRELAKQLVRSETQTLRLLTRSAYSLIVDPEVREPKPSHLEQSTTL